MKHKAKRVVDTGQFWIVYCECDDQFSAVDLKNAVNNFAEHFKDES